jgi:1-acyl-sn-glycerol-3-phosphate acyltransferase
MADRDERDYSPGWRRFTEIVLPTPIRGLMKLEAAGQSYFPPGGMIVAANHLSYADWPAMALFCYVAGHYPVFTIKSPVFDVKIIGPLMRKLGQLPVYRGRADAALVLKEAEQRIGRGACVIFYPEGTASRDPDQWPMVAKTGVARLALSTGAPVVPVACWGAQVILPYGSKRPKLFPRQTVKIAAGPPVDLSAFAGQPLTADTLRRTTDVIMADVTRLLAALRGEQPPAAPYDPRARRGETDADRGETNADRGQTNADQEGTDANRGQTDANRGQTDANRGQTDAGPAGGRAGAEPATGDRTVRGQAEDDRAGTEPAAGEPQNTGGGSDPQDTRKAQQG